MKKLFITILLVTTSFALSYAQEIIGKWHGVMPDVKNWEYLFNRFKEANPDFVIDERAERQFMIQFIAQTKETFRKTTIKFNKNGETSGQIPTSKIKNKGTWCSIDKDIYYLKDEGEPAIVKYIPEKDEIHLFNVIEDNGGFYLNVYKMNYIILQRVK